MQATFKTMRKYGAKIAAVGSLAVLGASAHAEGTGDNPLLNVLNSIDITGIGAAVAVLALAIVAIALTFKGPDLGKRVIRKI